MKSDETNEQDHDTERDNTQFLIAAVSHKLLSTERADQARKYANRHEISHVDAVLQLSLMEPAKVEAAQLLSRPNEFVPGYELIELIGSGASGSIFKANQLALQRPVALKTIKSHAPLTGESRMQREADAIARLQHPNIVVAHECGFAQGKFYITMELVEGGTLSDFIIRKSPVNEAVTWQIIRQAAAALSHANDAGIIHRDIKPANILLATAPAGSKLPPNVPFVKVADFGLARDFKGAEDARITATGVALGTPAYVAPEQLQNTAVDCRADIYGLGATAFHLLAGEMPCAGQAPMKLMMEKSLGKDQWREQLPSLVGELSAKLFRDMTETDPDQRVADYDELITRIDELLLAGGETADVVAKLPTRRQKPKMPRPRLIVGLAIFGIALGLGVVWQSGFSGLFGQSPPATSAHLAVPPGDWQPVGPPDPLFDGRSVPFRLVEGNWNPESASDGSLVLRGKENSSLHLPLATTEATTKNARLRLRVASAIGAGVFDVWFDANDSQAEKKQVAGKIRITDKEVMLFNENGQPVLLDKPFRFSDANSDSEPFRRLQIDRMGGTVAVLINGRRVGQWHVEPTADVTTVVRCKDGDAHVCDIDVVELTDVSSSAERAP